MNKKKKDCTPPAKVPRPAAVKPGLKEQVAVAKHTARHPFADISKL